MPDSLAPDRYTVLYGQVQVLTDQMARTMRDVQLLRQDGTPVARVERVEADVRQMAATLEEIRAEATELKRGDDRRKSLWDNLTKIVVAALTGGGAVFALQQLLGG